MDYLEKFSLADEYIAHVDTSIRAINDPFIVSRYVGFVVVSAVTVYELAIKEIFIDFAYRKHKVLGTFTSKHFERINGRIKYSDLMGDYLPRFGERYRKRFERLLESEELRVLRSDGRSVKSSYGNIVSWRHKFAHEGQIPNTPTYTEAKQSYQYGRKVIDILADTLKKGV